MQQRVIMLMDLDYFYAQVEELLDPSLRGKPVVVCMFSGRSESSGAVATSNYTARKFGVKSGIPIAFAKKRLAGVDSAFLPVRHELYEEYSMKVMEVLIRNADKFEQVSIDEAFIDVTERCKGDFALAEKLARKIKKEVLADVGLTCSIGVGATKIISKIACGMKKPDGLTVVLPKGSEKFLRTLPVSEIPGIGPKTTEALDLMGVYKVADLQKVSPALLIETFGKKFGAWLVLAAHGESDDNVEQKLERKQISRIRTLKEDSRDISYIMNNVEPLVKDVAAQLSEEGKVCSVVGINAVDENMEPHSKSRKLPRATADPKIIYVAVEALYRELLAGTSAELRRIGVRVENLEEGKGQKSILEF